MRQVTHVVERESKILGDVRDDVLTERTGGVAHGLKDLLRLGLVLREIVAAFTHHRPQFAIRPAGFLWGGHLLVHLAFQLMQQAHLGLQHIQRKPRTDADFGQVQRLVQRAALVAFQLDLQGSSAAGRLGTKKLVDADVERGGQVLEQPQLGFPLSVLDQAQLAGRRADGGAEVIEGQSSLLAQMPDPPAEADDVQAGGRGGGCLRRDFSVPASRRHF